MPQRQPAQETIRKLIDAYPELSACREDVEKAATLLISAYRQGGKLLLCGNGGSASDCEHIVGELMKGFASRRSLPAERRRRFTDAFPTEGDVIADRLQGALPAISLISHTSLLSAYANDVSAEMMFAQQVYGYGQPGDVLLGLSTSGNSLNVVRAFQVAKAMGVATVAMTGRSGGRLADIADVAVRVPYDGTPEVQERHLPIYHAICIILEKEFFAS